MGSLSLYSFFYRNPSHKKAHHHARRGTLAFTLVELSIVLVIIALIIISVLVGNELIEAARIYNLTSKINQYSTITTTFFDKYKAWPGDMPNATTFWGNLARNGNGNGLLESSAPGEFALHFYDFEYPQYWVHLSLSKLSPTAFDGSTVKGFGFPDIRDIGMIAVRWSRTGIFKNYRAFGQCFLLGIDDITNAHVYDQLTNPFTQYEAFALDRKMDDGKPKTGMINAFGYYKVSCGNNCTRFDSFAFPTNEYDTKSGNMLELIIEIPGW